MPLTADQITTDFVLDMAKTADECELDYGDPVGETLRLLVAERDELRDVLQGIVNLGGTMGHALFAETVDRAARRALSHE